MKIIKQIFLLALAFLALAPSQLSAKEEVDVKEILWGHIKDSYEWHVTKVGDTDVIIHLPVIVKSSTGWHVFSSSEFAHHADESGNRPGPYGLYIKNGDATSYPNKICEMVNGQEVRPLDLSITKTVCVLFIDAIILLLCVLIPARWCKKHKPEDPAPKGFVGLMHMFIMSVYDDVVKATLGKEADKYALPKDYAVINEILGLLTEKQRGRYYKAKALGMSSRTIAKEECCDQSSVVESISGAEKKIQKEPKKP